MWIERYIQRQVVTVGPTDSIFEARRLMTAHQIRHLPVVDGESRIMGIVSDRDVRSALPNPADDVAERTGALLVGEIMTTDPLTISPGFTLQDALIQFHLKKVGAFPIVDAGGRVIGILSDRDLLSCFFQVLGLGTPGCFIGLHLPPDEGRVKTVVSLLVDSGFPIASMVVIRDWKPGGWAMFLYVASQNRSVVERRVTAAGFSLIEPLGWLLSRCERRAA